MNPTQKDPKLIHWKKGKKGTFLHYCSFASGPKFYGGVFIVLDENQRANPLPYLTSLGLNPGGELLCVPHPAYVFTEDGTMIPVRQPETKYWNRLITDVKELEEAFGEKVQLLGECSKEGQAIFDRNMKQFGSEVPLIKNLPPN